MNLVEQLAHRAGTVKILAEAGIVRPSRPDRLLKAAKAVRAFGPTIAAGAVASAARHPDRPAIHDELGTLTWREVDERSNALANQLAAKGMKTGDGLAILCRNHRGFVDATLAAAKLGLTALYLNTQFSGPQIREVCERENPTAILYDEEFADFVEDAAKDRLRIVAWSDGGTEHSHAVLEDLIARGDRSGVSAPERAGRIVILTSGTTGTPKGAQRAQPKSVEPIASMLGRIPLKAGEPTMIAAPMFHSWGMAHFALGLSLSSTYVLRRRFSPEETLKAVAEHRCTALAVVPVMLQRILELDPEVLDRHDTSSLRVIAASGSALPGELAIKSMDRFGEVLYNLYGSTEVAWATIATPEDLRAAPGTAGRPPRGTQVRIVDEAGKEARQGETGRIFVGNEMAFEGYTGGGTKDMLEDGLMATGDVGHFDEGGRLFIDGRDDEMIVSGGENVFPREVEDLLADHDDVLEAAVIGVEDDQFGQRLKAFVVACPGTSPAEDDLKRYVKENLAGYKVPREIEFLDELPRNATGKVLKRELAER